MIGCLAVLKSLSRISDCTIDQSNRGGSIIFLSVQFKPRNGWLCRRTYSMWGRFGHSGVVITFPQSERLYAHNRVMTLHLHVVSCNVYNCTIVYSCNVYRITEFCTIAFQNKCALCRNHHREYILVPHYIQNDLQL